MFSIEDRVFIGGALIEIEDALGLSVNYLYENREKFPQSHIDNLLKETRVHRESLNYFFNTFCPNFGLNTDNIQAFKNEYRSLDARYIPVLVKNTNFDRVDIFGKPASNF